MNTISVLATNGMVYNIDLDSERMEYDYDEPIGESYACTDCDCRLICNNATNEYSVMPQY